MSNFVKLLFWKKKRAPQQEMRGRETEEGRKRRRQSLEELVIVGGCPGAVRTDSVRFPSTQSAVSVP